MPSEPFRFIHTADLSLGGQPRERLMCSDEVASVLQDATLSAWENIVAACIDEQVDFLLVTGQSFDPPEPDLRTELALRTGLEQLDEHQIRVFVIARHGSAARVWRDIDQQFDNVTIFFGREEEPVAVIREGRVLATIAGRARCYGAAETRSTDERRPFRIGVLEEALSSSPDSNEFRSATRHSAPTGPSNGSADTPATEPRTIEPHDELSRFLKDHPADYLALPSRTAAETIRIPPAMAHSPGASQGLSFSTASHKSCSLVQVSESRHVQIRTISTATVRWQIVPVTISHRISESDLVRQMRDSIRSAASDDIELIRIVRWDLGRAGSVANEWTDARLQNAWNQAVRDWDFARQVELVSVWKSVSVRLHDPAHAHPLWDHFELLLNENLPAEYQQLVELIHDSGLADQDWADVLTVLARQIDPAEIAQRVSTLGLEWFAAVSEKGAA